MAAPSVGATAAGKHRDHAAAIIRKHEEPRLGGSFIFVHLQMSAYGTKRTSRDVQLPSAFGSEADMGHTAGDVR
jgi:hypothetical protein